MKKPLRFFSKVAFNKDTEKTPIRIWYVICRFCLFSNSNLSRLLVERFFHYKSSLIENIRFHKTCCPHVIGLFYSYLNQSLIPSIFIEFIIYLTEQHHTGGILCNQFH